MTMHDKIMALEPIGCKSQVSALQFTNAKMRASQIAHEGDKLMEEMADALDFYAADDDVFDVAKSVLAKYNAYKEQS